MANAGYEQSFIPPVAAIERIEVIRGPMSSLYGSDAIGGVINIITRKVNKQWGGSLSWDYAARQHDDQSNAANTQFPWSMTSWAYRYGGASGAKWRDEALH